MDQVHHKYNYTNSLFNDIEDMTSSELTSVIVAERAVIAAECAVIVAECAVIVAERAVIVAQHK